MGPSDLVSPLMNIIIARIRQVLGLTGIEGTDVSELSDNQLS